MNMIEALNLAMEHPAGENCRPVRPVGTGWLVYYDATTFLGGIPYGFKRTHSVKEHGKAFSPSIEEVNGEWEEVDWRDIP